MITVDFSRCPIPLFPYQKEDVKKMLSLPYLALFSEMGSGKTAIAINTACALYDNQQIDAVLVACPAQCKSVWVDPELGEISKHAWVQSVVHNFYGGNKAFKLRGGSLNWVVSSYEFLRRSDPLDYLIKQLQNNRIMLIADESIFLKSHRAIQTRHLYELAQVCSRRYVLNGTPHGGDLGETYCQFAILSKEILACKNYFHFLARYAIKGGFRTKQIVGWRRTEDYVRRTAPYVIRRLKSEVLKDLPPKTYTHLTVPLTSENWKRYKQMRDDLCLFLDSAASTTQHAVVKAMRLSQVCAGFIGGVTDVDPEEFELLGFEGQAPIVAMMGEVRTEEIGTEKLDFVLGWLKDRLVENRAFRVLMWCRFVKELQRLHEHIAKQLPDVKLFGIHGGQKKADRQEAKAEGEVGAGGCIILGNPHAGGFGLNLVTLPNVFYVSSDYSLLTRLQSEDRVHRPGQKASNVLYTDLIATGPEGQKTIDHAVLAALTKKEDLAKWSSDRWRQALMEE